MPNTSLIPRSILLLPLVKPLLDRLRLRLIIPGRRLLGRQLRQAGDVRLRGRGRRLDGRRGRRHARAGSGGRVRGQVVVVHRDAGARLAHDVARVQQPLVHDGVLGVELVHAAVVEDQLHLDPRDVGGDMPAGPRPGFNLPAPGAEAEEAARSWLRVVGV